MPTVRALALALTFTLAACGSSDGGPAVEVGGLRLVEARDGSPILSGVVYNRAQSPVASAEVFVQLYDADNLPIEDVRVTVQRLAPGDSSRFERALDVPASAASVRYVIAN